MQNSFYDDFMKNWEKFRTRLQGQVMMQAKKGILNHASLNLILADCTEFWDSDHSEGGRWLNELEKAFPQKAELVRNILLNDMKFTEEADAGSKNGILQLAVPVGSAAAGFSLSKLMGASTLIQAVCTVVPAAVAFPLTKNIVGTLDDNKRKDVIGRYIAQLEKYRLSIESIVKDVSADKIE